MATLKKQVLYTVDIYKIYLHIFFRVTCIKELREAGLAVNTEARGPVGTASTEAAEEEEEEQYEDPETVLLLQHKVTLFLSQKLVGKRKKVGSFA